MQIIAYTDGSCSGNPGPGGYAAIVKCDGMEHIIRGHSSKCTTNNRMEIKPIIELLDWVTKNQKSPCEIIVYTDSQYILDCLYGKNKDGSKRRVSWFKGRKNEDLWMQLISKTMSGKHTVRFIKVVGHSGDETNERVDKIAKEECCKAKHELV